VTDHDEQDTILRDLANFDLKHHTVGDLRAIVFRAREAVAGSATPTGDDDD
jgi:hypothetical protein